jgi:ABC-type proline/glycine betaine transport system permease subunit
MGMDEFKIFEFYCKIESLTDEAKEALMETVNEKNIDIEKIKKTIQEENLALRKIAEDKHLIELQKTKKSTKYWAIVALVCVIIGILGSSETYISTIKIITQASILAAISGAIFGVKKWARKRDKQKTSGE